MRWIVVCLGSLASGVLTIIASLVILIVSVAIYTRYVLGIPSNEAVGWDPISLFGHWKFVVVGIPLLIFVLGCSLGFWVLHRLLLR